MAIDSQGAAGLRPNKDGLGFQPLPSGFGRSRTQQTVTATDRGTLVRPDTKTETYLVRNSYMIDENNQPSGVVSIGDYWSACGNRKRRP
jgi:hypothetical protein